MSAVDSGAPLTADSSEHVRLTSRAATLSVVVSLLLMALKAWAWFNSASVAMLASLADSTLDLIASLFTYFAVRYAAAPPDREHRFGHGKAEAFAGLVQAGLVGASALVIAMEAVRRAFKPEPLKHGLESIGVMVVSMALTAGLVVMQTQAIKRTGSVATRADRLHYAGDLATNLVVIAGIAAGALLHWPTADAAAGFLVAAWLAWGAVHVARESADALLDHEAPEPTRARIRALALADPRVLHVHALRTRVSGPYLHVQFHAALDPDQSLEAAHAITVAAEERIRAEFPTADVLIHPDPKGRSEPHGHQDFRSADH